MSYRINYSGEFVNGFDAAKAKAERGASRAAGRDITITTPTGEVVARRRWNKTLAYIEDHSRPIRIGSGYYGDWQE